VKHRGRGRVTLTAGVQYESGFKADFIIDEESKFLEIAFTFTLLPISSANYCALIWRKCSGSAYDSDATSISVL
jgi:hypothetical protein